MQLKLKWLSFLALRWYTVQVSHVYKRVGSTTALYVVFQLSIKSDSISF